VNKRADMPLCRWAWFLAVVWALPAAGQIVPSVGYVYPAGAQRGSAVEIAVGGLWLKEVDRVHVSGRGVRAEIVEYIEPDYRKIKALMEEANRLEAELEAQRGEAAMESGDELNGSSDRQGDGRVPPELRRLRREIRRIRWRMFDPQLQVSPQIGDTLRLRVTVDADAAPGRRSLRVVSPHGASNPLTFMVGTLPETAEDLGVHTPAETDLPEMPAVVNGQIMAGQVDRYRFSARQGQRLVIRAEARALIPYLADAVPGWFQAVLTVTDAEGRQVACVDDYRFDPDPVMLLEVPADGDYVLSLRDAIYRGRLDFVYRLTVGELPFITERYPPGGPGGEETVVTLDGWNLPDRRLAVTPRADGTGVHPVTVSADGMTSNAMPFAVGAGRETLEAEPNHDTAPQAVHFPLTINGRIDSPEDRDAFSFRGRAGQPIVAEVHARRLMSPLDAVIELLGPDGQVLAANDDHPDPAAGLLTHHADPYLTATLPASGRYVLRLRDIQGHGSSAHAYRLRLSSPQPDFDVRLIPSAVHVTRGGNAPLTVHVLRRDGFDGPVTLALAGGAEGLTLTGGVPAGEDSACLTLSADGRAETGLLTPRLTAAAVIDGRVVTRPVTPAEDMMQAFLWRHLVEADQSVVTIGRRAKVTIEAVGFSDGEVLGIPAGGSVEIRVRSSRRLPRANDNIKFALTGAPEGLTLAETTVPAQRRDMPLTILADAQRLPVGRKGTFAVTVMLSRRVLIPICHTLAIPFEIIEP